MLSSTRIPMVRVRARVVRKLRVKPCSHITPKVAIREVGMASSTITVLRQECRKTSSTRPVSRTASIRVRCTPVRELRMKTELSVMTSSSAPSGSSGWMRATSARTAAAVLVTLAVACLVTVIPTASLPLTRLRRVWSLKPSTTVATSRTRTWPPLGRVLTTVPSMSPGERNLASTRRLKFLPGSRTWPPGRSTFSAPRAWVTCCRVSPKARRRAGSTSTCTSRCCPPKMDTCPTPLWVSRRLRMRSSARR